MRASQVSRLLDRTASVQEQWVAWLPEEKERVYTAALKELEVSYVILSVSLDDGFALCKQGKLQAAREQAVVFAALYDRLAERLRIVVRSVGEHGRQFGTHSRVAPLRLDWFRSETARQMVRHHRLAARFRMGVPSHFFHKLKTLDETMGSLQKEARQVSDEIADGTTLRWRTRWGQLEMLHDDLNTCLRELTVVLKSFFCMLPLEQLAAFDKRLRSLNPAPVAGSRRRWDALLPKMAPI